MSTLNSGPYQHNRFAAIDDLYERERQYYTQQLAEKKKAKPDFLDVDGDGDKEESFKKGVKDKEKGEGKKDDKKDGKKELPAFLQKKKDVKEAKCSSGCDCEDCKKDKKKEMNDHIEKLAQEGYDLSKFTYDELLETYIDEGIGSFMKNLTGQEAKEKKALINKTFRYRTPRGGDGKKCSDKNDPRKKVKGVTVSKKKAVSEWIHNLVADGYNLSEYTMEDMERLSDQAITEETQEVTIEEAVMQYLMDNGFANNAVSAEVVYNNMSEGWRDDVVNQIHEGLQNMSKLGTELSKRRTDNLHKKEYAAAGKGDEKGANKAMQDRLKVNAARSKYGAK